MPEDSLSSVGTLNPAGGFLRAALIAGIPVLTNNASFRSPNDFQYTKYALAPPFGPRQKTGHSRGTSQPSFSLAGDLTVESAGLLQFLDPAARGQPFAVAVNQSVGALTDATIMSPVFLESLSFSGGPNSLVQYSISGKGLAPPFIGPLIAQPTYQHPLPGWSSGNSLVRSWNLTHSINLGANWANDQNPFPVYYRPGESEWTMQVTTVLTHIDYGQINISIGNFFFVEGLVTSRSVNYAGRDVVTFQVEVTNVNLHLNAYSPGGVVTPNPVIPSAWPDGV